MSRWMSALLVVSGCSFTPGQFAKDDAGSATDDAQPDAPPSDVLVDVEPDSTPPCDGYTMTTSGYYLVVSTPTAWPDAKTACEATGGYLAVIGDTTENAVVRGLVPTTTRFWLGMSDLAVENTWVWLDNSAVPRDTQYWDGGQPNDSQANGGEDCGEMSNAGTWNDDNCSVPEPYVCECDP